MKSVERAKNDSFELAWARVLGVMRAPLCIALSASLCIPFQNIAFAQGDGSSGTAVAESTVADNTPSESTDQSNTGEPTAEIGDEKKSKGSASSSEASSKEEPPKTPFQAALDSTDYKAWSDAKLSLDLIKGEYLNYYNCGQSELKFLACVRAINAFFEFLYIDAKLEPLNYMPQGQELERFEYLYKVSSGEIQLPEGFTALPRIRTSVEYEQVVNQKDPTQRLSPFSSPEKDRAFPYNKELIEQLKTYPGGAKIVHRAESRDSARDEAEKWRGVYRSFRDREDAFEAASRRALDAKIDLAKLKRKVERVLRKKEKYQNQVDYYSSLLIGGGYHGFTYFGEITEARIQRDEVESVIRSFDGELTEKEIAFVVENVKRITPRAERVAARVDFEVLLDQLELILVESFRNSWYWNRLNDVRVVSWLHMLNTYTRVVYGPKSQFRLESQDLPEQEPFGEGIELAMIDAEGSILVKDIHEEHPSFEAGLRKGDIILPGVFRNPYELYLWIKQENGDDIEIAVKRGDDLVVLEIPAVPMEFEMTYAKELKNSLHRIGYLQIERFTHEDRDSVSSCEEVAFRLAEGDADPGSDEGTERLQDMESLVIDLRNTTGGSLDELLCIASMFIDGKEPLFRLFSLKADGRPFGNGRKKVARTTGYKFPLRSIVILQNSQTSGMAEVFSAVMQDLGRAIVVGERTFGDASLIEGITPPYLKRTYRDRKSVADLTTERIVHHYRAKTIARLGGQFIEFSGVQPDIELEMNTVVGPNGDAKSNREVFQDYLGAMEFESPVWEPMDLLNTSRAKTCSENHPSNRNRFTAPDSSDGSIDHRLLETGEDYPLLYAMDTAECLLFINQEDGVSNHYYYTLDQPKAKKKQKSHDGHDHAEGEACSAEGGACSSFLK